VVCGNHMKLRKYSRWRQHVKTSITTIDDPALKQRVKQRLVMFKIRQGLCFTAGKLTMLQLFHSSNDPSCNRNKTDYQKDQNDPRSGGPVLENNQKTQKWWDFGDTHTFQKQPMQKVTDEKIINMSGLNLEDSQKMKRGHFVCVRTWRDLRIPKQKLNKSTIEDARVTNVFWLVYKAK
jgi:hypothetical protein